MFALNENNASILSMDIGRTMGDFGRVAEYTKGDGTDFIRGLALESGSRVLDVGCGHGFQSIDAAKAGGEVTGVDIDAASLEQARSAAARESVNANFYKADVQHLPFADASFDAVVSFFGAMFAPRPDLVAAEMHRVCRRGGLIAMANWMPDGIIGQMFRLVSRYVRPVGYWPFEWGRAPFTRMCFGDAVEQIEFSGRAVTMTFPFPVPAVVDFWMTYCRLFACVFGQLGPGERMDLRLDLEWLWSDHNISADERTTVVDAACLEMRAVRRKDHPVPNSFSLKRDSF